MGVALQCFLSTIAPLDSICREIHKHPYLLRRVTLDIGEVFAKIAMPRVPPLICAHQ